jgi:hypothetical protein
MLQDKAGRFHPGYNDLTSVAFLLDRKSQRRRPGLEIAFRRIWIGLLLSGEQQPLSVVKHLDLGNPVLIRARCIGIGVGCLGETATWGRTKPID